MNLTGAHKFEELCRKNNSIWMGIINLTPDSFSDGGLYNIKQKALNRAQELVNKGAKIIDFGGVSTRPFPQEINANTELERVYEVIFSARAILPKDILISIDSYSPLVTNRLAKEGLIDIINDPFSSSCEEQIELENNSYIKINNAFVAAKYKLGYIIMHMQGKPNNMQLNPQYRDCGHEVISFLKEKIQFVEKEGVSFIAVDPGIGFGKLLEHNLELLSKNFLNNLSKLGKPILIGLSRKSFLAKLYPECIEPVSRDKVTKEFEWKCIQNGVKIIRSHVMPSEL
ncbi:dihydropteroate synthase [Silvanigrella aquatica]|uniref:dihydropteroate synthase n=1 Tax=Silvanigrella aquatica TaxID=1915309 RepID=A0A1L4CXD2_9BACT|nr:dihydropteroate synthase [Silvanigrella aquatica]APJ02605.1 dihydropteroate synthase [Silvanigrella aquatica]